MANYVDTLDANSPGSGLPSGWTKRTALSATHSLADDGGGDIYFRTVLASSSRYPYTLDAVDSDTDRADFEVLGLVRTSGTASVNHVGVCGRVTDGDNLYSLNITGGEVRMQRVVGSAGSSLDLTAGKGLAADTLVYLRFRCVGSTGNFLKGKAWAYGDSEPSAWDIEVGDVSPITGAGSVGFSAHSTVNNHDLLAIAIATNGDTASLGGDSTAPVLTSPTGTATGSTTATVGATTDEGNGTQYAFVSTSATPPSATDLKAGTGATWAGSITISSTGANTHSATGLTASTGYYAHLIHTDAAANDSNIVTSAQFTTSAPGVFPPVLNRAFNLSILNH